MKFNVLPGLMFISGLLLGALLGRSLQTSNLVQQEPIVDRLISRDANKRVTIVHDSETRANTKTYLNQASRIHLLSYLLLADDNQEIRAKSAMALSAIGGEIRKEEKSYIIVLRLSQSLMHESSLSSVSQPSNEFLVVNLLDNLLSFDLKIRNLQWRKEIYKTCSPYWNGVAKTTQDEDVRKMCKKFSAWFV